MSEWHGHWRVMVTFACGILTFQGRSGATTYKVMQAARRKSERRAATTAAAPTTQKAQLEGWHTEAMAVSAAAWCRSDGQVDNQARG
jgi:uncharacterized membrane protein YebE (DUF533 family)